VDTAHVTLNASKTASGREVLQIKFGSQFGELNVYASPADRAALSSIREARWNARASVRLGSVFGLPAWWSVEDGELTILVGSDDETWDVAFTLPASVLDELERQWTAA
jgi:hypothetical protein